LSDVIVETIRESLLILNKDFLVIRANQAFYRTFGVSPSQTEGRSVFEIGNGQWNIPELKNLLAGVLANGEACSDYLVEHEFPHIGRRSMLLNARRIADFWDPLVLLAIEDVTQRESAAATLRRNEERMRALVKAMPDPFFVLDEDGRYVEVLTSSEHLLYADLRSLLGKTLHDVLPMEFAERFLKAVRSCLEHNAAWVIEYELIVPAGLRSFEAKIAPIRGRPEEKRVVIVVSRDITDRKNAADSLRASEARLAQAQRITHLGSWEMDLENGVLDRTVFIGNAIHWSDESYRILGYEPGVSLSGNLHFDAVHPDDRDILWRTITESIAADRPFRCGHRIVRPDGSQRWLDALGEIVPSAAGKPARLFVTLHDVTDRRRIEEALRASEEMFRQIAENINEVFYLQDVATGSIDYISPAVEKLSGHTVESLRRSPTAWLEAIHPDDREKVLGQLARENAERPSILTYRFVKPDGAVGWARDRFFPVRGPDGRVTKVAGVIEDITESIKNEALEEQLRQSQKMEAVGQLAGGVAHDFNNLLTAILGYCGLLLSQIPKDDPIREDVMEIQRSGDRAAKLTRQLLAFGRKQVLNPRPLDLNALVLDMDKILRRLIGENIEMVTLLGVDLGNILADTSQIEQVIMNLCVNARDAMPLGGKLTIETRAVLLDEDFTGRHVGIVSGWHILLTVTDTGCGMTEEIKARIFEPFFTTKPPAKGTGLGLSTVFGIVKQSGGHIWVYSEPQRGTAFKIFFPRSTNEPAAPRSGDAQSVRAPGGSETILFVEDDPGIRNFVQRLLKERGYRVLTAMNGDEALVLAKSETQPVHILITDVVMPGMSGRQLAKELLKSWPDVKVLFISGYTEDAIIHHGVLEKGSNFLSKPFSSEDLASTLRQILDRTESAG
jgi:two-component system, cell cycle sensor histidine kinase and response regulator CckA